jgi:hypothetical protein
MKTLQPQRDATKQDDGQEQPDDGAATFLVLRRYVAGRHERPV